MYRRSYIYIIRVLASVFAIIYSCTRDTRFAIGTRGSGIASEIISVLSPGRARSERERISRRDRGSRRGVPLFERRSTFTHDDYVVVCRRSAATTIRKSITLVEVPKEALRSNESTPRHNRPRRRRLSGSIS